MVLLARKRIAKCVRWWKMWCLWRSEQQHQPHINRFRRLVSVVYDDVGGKRLLGLRGEMILTRVVDSQRTQTNEWIYASQAVFTTPARLNEIIESDYIVAAFAQAKPSEQYNIAINRKMDGHNRKRKDVIYFYYRQTAFDGFADRVWVCRESTCTMHYKVPRGRLRTNINVLTSYGRGIMDATATSNCRIKKWNKYENSGDTQRSVNCVCLWWWLKHSAEGTLPTHSRRNFRRSSRKTWFWS